MPINYNPNPETKLMEFAGQDLGYVYPGGLDLKPGSPIHTKIINWVMDRVRESYKVIQPKFVIWKEIERSLTAYVQLDEKEKKVKSIDSRKPMSIVVPYTYATLETLLTYWVAAFLDSPIFRYEGVSPEDKLGVILLEKVIDQQVSRSKMGLALHTQARDSFVYGFGAVHPRWTKRMGFKSLPQEEGVMSVIKNIFLHTGMTKRRVEAILYEGNELINIDPYLFLPDPNVAIHKVQDGEYVAWIHRTSYYALLEMERYDSSVFNVRYLEKADGRSSVCAYNDESSRTERFGLTTSQNVVTKPIDMIYIYGRIIPKEFGLSGGVYPEKWLFGIGADSIVTSAMPLGLDHNMYPIGIMAPDYDGYSASPISKLEVTYGLQQTLDWLFSSHIANVRKAINDMLIVDPYMVNIKDLRDPGAGKLIRLRKAAWGRGVENAVKQLKVEDVTRQHIQEAPVIIELIQRCTGAVDILQGIRRKTSERVSATEADDTRKSALSRLAKAAKISSLQSMQDIGYMLASHTQQLLSRDQYVKTVGAWQEVLQEEYGITEGYHKITPFDLLVEYDVVVRDGSTADMESGDLWGEIFRIVSAQPYLNEAFDIVRIFRHLARISGAKNVEDFIRKGGSANIKVASNKMVESEAQKGNITPVPTTPVPA